MAEPLRLYGLKAVVTGAGSGIGEATARTLIKHGAEVLAIDSPNSAITTQYESVRGITGVAVDMLAPDAAAKIADAADTELGNVDILICNVTPPVEKPINDDDDEQLSQLIQRTQQLVDDICQLCMPMMKASPAGRIVILGFIRSIFGKDGKESFAKSTAAIADFTARLAAEAGKYGVNANYIQPGAVMTPESRRVFSSDKELRDFCISASAAKRLGEPIDIAKVALFLSTDDSVFVSGTGIVVDGGIA